MSKNSVLYQSETSIHAAEIETLHELAFGPGRFARTAFRIREKKQYDITLSFVAISQETIVGSVRLTSISVGTEPALLLGPLVVHPMRKNEGIGRHLVRMACDAARQAEHQFILLVGDVDYYGHLGFESIISGVIKFPGPVDPARVLATPLGDRLVGQLGGRVS